MNDISISELRERLSYCADSGLFRWRSGPRTGLVAGNKNACGYWVVGLNGKQYGAHRLAWLYVYGVVPDGEIDHIDRNRLNNRLNNLRVTSRTENAQNMSMINGPIRRNKSGVIGVSWNKSKKRWAVNITADGKRKFLGYFDDIEEARLVREQAKRELHIETLMA